MSLRATRRDLALAVAVAGATAAWRTGASPLAAIASGTLSAAIAYALHRLITRLDRRHARRGPTT